MSSALTTLPSNSPSLRFVPQWLLRLIGLSSLAIALIQFAASCRLAFFGKHAATTVLPEQKRLKRTSSSLADIQNGKLQNSYQIPSPPRRQPSPTSPHGATQAPWRSRLFNTLNLKKKKIMTVSVKNTILWNPSQDVELPNHAFHENAVALMMRLCAQYEVHFLVQSNTDEERDQLHALLLPLRRLVDPSRVVYCSDAATKQRIVRAISPDVHVEGGWELDDGEDMVRALRDNVDKIVWIITRRRRTSFNKHNIQQKDQDILTPNVELTDAFLDTTLAEQVGFVVDN